MGGLLIAALVLAIVLAGGCAVIFRLTLARGARVARTGDGPDRPGPRYYREGREWWEAASRVELNLTRDKIRLKGWYIKNGRSNKTAVLLHGYTNSASCMGSAAKTFYELGYNVFAADARAHGGSGGRYIGMGWPDRLDCLGWLNLLNEACGGKYILYGVSMGAATALMLSGERPPAFLRAIISDCAYESVYAEFYYQLKAFYRCPAFPVLHATSAICSLLAGYSFKEASALEQVKKSATPTLFIHGGADVFVPVGMMERLYEAAACPKEKLIVEGAGHALSAAENPELYWPAVTSFLERYV